MFDIFTSDVRRASLRFSEIMMDMSYHSFDVDTGLSQWQDTVDLLLELPFTANSSPELLFGKGTNEFANIYVNWGIEDPPMK